MREPTVVGHEHKNLGAHFGKTAHLRRVCILEAYGDTQFHAVKVESLQLSGCAAPDRSQFLKRLYPLVARYELAERNEMNLVIYIARAICEERGRVVFPAVIPAESAGKDPLRSARLAYPVGETCGVGASESSYFAEGAFGQDDKLRLHRRYVAEQIPVYRNDIFITAVEDAREVPLHKRHANRAVAVAAVCGRH